MVFVSLLFLYHKGKSGICATLYNYAAKYVKYKAGIETMAHLYKL